MIDGGENCHGFNKSPRLLEMTSAYIQVLLKVKGIHKFPSRSVQESS